MYAVYTRTGAAVKWVSTQRLGPIFRRPKATQQQNVISVTIRNFANSRQIYQKRNDKFIRERNVYPCVVSLVSARPSWRTLSLPTQHRNIATCHGIIS